MLASGRLPPFPGGPSGPAGFLQRISTLTSSLFPFFLDFSWRYMPASTLSGRSVALLRVRLDDCTPSEGQLISHGNCARSLKLFRPGQRVLPELESNGLLPKLV